jgi:hypothetical protein
MPKIFSLKNSLLTKIFMLCAAAVFLFFPSKAMAAVNAKTAANIPVESPAIKIIMDGSALNLKNNVPIISNERALLPLRVIFEAMGANVDWDSAAKTVTASHRGDILRLTLNSSTAFKNGLPLNLDTPSLIYKDRVYIPVRFTGEAFGASVSYDAATKEITIKNSSPSATELRGLKINLNGLDLKFDAPPILLKGTRYIPLDEMLYFTAYVLKEKDNFEWSKDAYGNYRVYFDRVEKTFSLDNTVSFKNPPIVYEGIAYAPLRLAEELLGAKIYTAPDGFIYLYVNRSTLKHSYVPLAGYVTAAPLPVDGAAFEGERLLSVSDNPEILTPSTVPEDSAVLWASNEVAFNGRFEHRIFAWHISQIEKNARIGVTIENSGSVPLTVSNIRGYGKASEDAWGIYDVGLPIADAILSGLVDKTSNNGKVIAAGEILLLQEYEINPGNLLGFINDFDIFSGTGRGKYKVRVVFSAEEEKDLTQIKSSPLPIDTANKHPRGNWQSSVIRAEIPLFEAGDPEICYSISNGVSDNLYTAEASIGNGAETVANPGHFGASYKILVPVFNGTAEDKKISIRLSARGGQYMGAVKNPKGIFLIPSITPHSNTAELYLHTAPPGESAVELEIMHAGASSLAVAISIAAFEETPPPQETENTENENEGFNEPEFPIDVNDPLYQYQNDPDNYEVKW